MIESPLKTRKHHNNKNVKLNLSFLTIIFIQQKLNKKQVTKNELWRTKLHTPSNG